MSRVAIIGAGAYGTALANASARAGHTVNLIGRDSDAMAAMAQTRENSAYLPGCLIDPAVTPSTELALTAHADLLLIAVPTQSTRAALRGLAPLIRDGQTVVLCAKGIEQDSGALPPDILKAEAPQARVALLSGPSFAADIARGLPTAVTLAAETVSLAEEISNALGSARFRLYHTDDLRGVAIGGAAKNVMAIASGLVAGLALGASAQAALITRAFAELMRFGLALGARPDTLTGLSGLGDLILTCNSPQSRNFALGQALASGKNTSGKLAEGAFTADILCRMARDHQVDMPIADAVDAVLKGTLLPATALDTLMARPQRQEGWT